MDFFLFACLIFIILFHVSNILKLELEQLHEAIMPIYPIGKEKMTRVIKIWTCTNQQLIIGNIITDSSTNIRFSSNKHRYSSCL